MHRTPTRHDLVFKRSVVGVALSALLGATTIGAAPVLKPTLADDRVEASYNSGNQFVHDAEFDELLSRVAKRIQDANPDARCLALRLHALDEPLPYSFGLKNGAFYVSTGLIARIDSEAELAALIALPLAALCRGDADQLRSDQRQRILKNLVPDLLLVTLTIGITAPSLRKHDEQQDANDRDQLRDASDTLALQWLAAAGYDPAAAPLALTQLLDSLAAEDRSGAPEFANAADLDTRRESLTRLLATSAPAPTPPTATTPAVAADALRKLSWRYAMNLARIDVGSHPTGLLPLLDRIDARDGPSGYSAYLRAEFARHDSGTDAGVAAAIAAYEKCVTFSDAPPAAYRELGFLYRRAGDQRRARDVFVKYLQKAPNAVDGPIIRTYLEVQ